MSSIRKKHNTPWSEKTRGVMDELKGGAKEEVPSPKISVSWAWPGTWMEWFEEISPEIAAKSYNWPGLQSGEGKWQENSPKQRANTEKQFVGPPGIPGTHTFVGWPGLQSYENNWQENSPKQKEDLMTGKTPYRVVGGKTSYSEPTWEFHEDYMRRRREEVEKERALKSQISKPPRKDQKLYGDEIWRAEIKRLEQYIKTVDLNYRQDIQETDKLISDLRNELESLKNTVSCLDETVEALRNIRK